MLWGKMLKRKRVIETMCKQSTYEIEEVKWDIFPIGIYRYKGIGTCSHIILHGE